jgi:integrase
VFGRRATRYFGDLPVDQIDLQAVHGWQQTMTDLAPRSVNLMLAHLCSVLRLAHEYKLIAEPPAIRKVPSPPACDEFSTPNVADRLVAHADPIIRDALDFAFRTGLRVGEWRQLRWVNVDFANRMVRVVENVVRNSVGTPKSGKVRVIPFTPYLEQLLLRRRDANPTATFVFGGPRGGRIKEGCVYERLAAAYSAAGIPRRPGQAWHHCRHSFASNLAKRQPLLVVSKLLGHSTITMTQRYAHLQTSDLQSALLSLDPQVGDSVTECGDHRVTPSEARESGAVWAENGQQSHTA